ncbi:MAG TPA: hypothetical protein VKI44_03655 [Acetobacteraceae bacterium]|nr:hypothetical protein [Acetobacteraceae bacterium]
MEQAASLNTTAAVKMQFEAQKHRLVADHLEAQGDMVGPRYERAEAERLEGIADLALDPLMHTTGPVTAGNGGEVAIGTSRYVDTVRERPDMLAIDASQQRMSLADKANALTLGIDAAATIQPKNSLEKMLAHEMAAAHALAMELQAEGRELLRVYKRTGHIHQHVSIEAGRLFNASARMMTVFQDGLLTLQKIRSGGTQHVVVQHINVGDGGRAVVAGEVKVRRKRGRRPGATDGGVARK